MNGQRLVLATGGSGGHIYPALAVAEQLQAHGHDLLFVGQQGGMEARIIPAAGFAFAAVRAGKWARGRPDPRQALQALLGLGDALRRVRKHNPALVVGFGGFASFPALAAARLLGIPIALHEQNAFPGRVTRWFAGQAQLLALADAGAAQHLPTSCHVEVVGLPIRETRISKDEARHALGLPASGLVTLVMGGSQGSVALNQAVPEAYQMLPQALRESMTVLHSSGTGHAQRLQTAMTDPNYRILPYVDATLAWSAADLAITRAGMSTLAEAAFHGVPLIMVPLPTAAENHQAHNARAVESAGAGKVVLQSELDDLAEAWRELLDDGARQAAASAARRLSPEGAAARLAHQIEALLGSAPPSPIPTGAPHQEKQ
ncbi:MAG TPA: undecaprenyldiphospho-muramoylpentapeptide beta-N-acetylglucosaminyltransferase [Trueperaceae bacterium]